VSVVTLADLSYDNFVCDQNDQSCQYLNYWFFLYTIFKEYKFLFIWFFFKDNPLVLENGGLTRSMVFHQGDNIDMQCKFNKCLEYVCGCSLKYRTGGLAADTMYL